MLLDTLIVIYCIGYLANIFSWFFSKESIDYIRAGDIGMLGILVGSLRWPYALYISISSAFKQP